MTLQVFVSLGQFRETVDQTATSWTMCADADSIWASALCMVSTGTQCATIGTNLSDFNRKNEKKMLTENMHFQDMVQIAGFSAWIVLKANILKAVL